MRVFAANWRVFSVGAAGVSLLAGIILLLWCVRELYVVGRGTLAPWEPPALGRDRLVSLFSQPDVHRSVQGTSTAVDWLSGTGIEAAGIPAHLLRIHHASANSLVVVALGGVQLQVPLPSAATSGAAVPVGMSGPTRLHHERT